MVKSSFCIVYIKHEQYEHATWLALNYKEFLICFYLPKNS